MAHPDDRDYRRAIRASAAKPGQDFIVLDTLGKLLAHGVGLAGWCQHCASSYWDDVRARRTPKPSSFKVDLPALIAERGPNCLVVGLRPVTCPYCGSTDTKTHLVVPRKGAGT